MIIISTIYLGTSIIYVPDSTKRLYTLLEARFLWWVHTAAAPGERISPLNVYLYNRIPDVVTRISFSDTNQTVCA